MNRFKCPACGGNQYTACDTSQECIYCGYKGQLMKMKTLEPEESEGEEFGMKKLEVPDGYKEVTEIVTGVFVNEKTGEIVITGIPETVLHNCDQMGCSSIDHVIYRCRLEQ